MLSNLQFRLFHSHRALRPEYVVLQHPKPQEQSPLTAETIEKEREKLLRKIDRTKRLLGKQIAGAASDTDLQQLKEQLDTITTKASAIDVQQTSETGTVLDQAHEAVDNALKDLNKKILKGIRGDDTLLGTIEDKLKVSQARSTIIEIAVGMNKSNRLVTADQIKSIFGQDIPIEALQYVVGTNPDGAFGRHSMAMLLNYMHLDETETASVQLFYDNNKDYLEGIVRRYRDNRYLDVTPTSLEKERSKRRATERTEQSAAAVQGDIVLDKVVDARKGLDQTTREDDYYKGIHIIVDTLRKQFGALVKIVPGGDNVKAFNEKRWTDLHFSVNGKIFELGYDHPSDGQYNFKLSYWSGDQKVAYRLAGSKEENQVRTVAQPQEILDAIMPYLNRTSERRVNPGEKGIPWEELEKEMLKDPGKADFYLALGRLINAMKQTCGIRDITAVNNDENNPRDAHYVNICFSYGDNRMATITFHRGSDGQCFVKLWKSNGSKDELDDVGGGGTFANLAAIIKQKLDTD